MFLIPCPDGREEVVFPSGTMHGPAADKYKEPALCVCVSSDTGLLLLK